VKINRTLKPLTLGCVAAILGNLDVPAANAQLEEVLVTATKRAENPQDIPLSIEVISGETMRDMGITDFVELQSTVPNLNVAYGITTEVITIRGLGSGSERSFEQSVGMFIDGFYMPRSRQYQSPFFDVARVEVARGPQSAIHGLNSTAGAISIVTNKTMPGDPFVLDVMADYETQYGGGGVEAIIGGSPTDNIGLRLAVKASERDGFYENSFTGRDEGDTDSMIIRASAIFELTDRTTLGLKYEIAEREMDGNTGELFGGNTSTFAAVAGAEPDDGRLNWRRSSNGCDNDPMGFPAAMSFEGAFPHTCPKQESDLETVIINLEHEFESSVMSVMVGRSEFEYDITVDLDTMSASFLDSSIDENFEQDAFEIRLTSTNEGNFDWLAGFYYHNWENFNENPATYGPGLFGGLLSGFGPFGTNVAIRTSGTFDQESEVLSAFAQGTFHVTDRFRITGGLRFTTEDKESSWTTPCSLIFLDAGSEVQTPLPGTLNLCNSNPALEGLVAERSSDNWLPELALQWDLSDAVMVYAKASSSAKSGGFTSSTRNPPTDWQLSDQEYDDEEVFGYEVGLKSTLLDNRLEFNVAAYDTEFDDLQVNTFTPTNGVIVQRVTNAAKASSSGVELDLRFAASETLLLGASVAFQDVKYDSFVNGTCSVESGLASPCDQSGQPLPLAADHSGNVYANLTLPISGALNFVANLSVSFSDSYYTSTANDPIGEQSSYEKIDARIGIEASDQRWSVAVVGRNLGDEEVLGSTQTFFNPLLQPTALGYLEPPMTVSVQARYRFGN